MHLSLSTPVVFTWLSPCQRQIVSKMIEKCPISLRTNPSNLVIQKKLLSIHRLSRVILILKYLIIILLALTVKDYFVASGCVWKQLNCGFFGWLEVQSQPSPPDHHPRNILQMSDELCHSDCCLPKTYTFSWGLWIRRKTHKTLNLLSWMSLLPPPTPWE